MAGILFAQYGDMTTYQLLAVGFAIFGIALILIGRRKNPSVDAPTDKDALPVPKHPA